MVSICCLTALLLLLDFVQLSWLGGKLLGHFLMGMYKIHYCHGFKAFILILAAYSAGLGLHYPCDSARHMVYLPVLSF